jgi:hypothetical protein
VARTPQCRIPLCVNMCLGMQDTATILGRACAWKIQPHPGERYDATASKLWYGLELCPAGADPSVLVRKQ